MSRPGRPPQDLTEVSPAAAWGGLQAEGAACEEQGTARAAQASSGAKCCPLFIRPLTGACVVLRRLLFLATPDQDAFSNAEKKSVISKSLRVDWLLDSKACWP